MRRVEQVCAPFNPQVFPIGRHCHRLKWQGTAHYSITPSHHAVQTGVFGIIVTQKPPPPIPPIHAPVSNYSWVQTGVTALAVDTIRQKFFSGGSDGLLKVFVLLVVYHVFFQSEVGYRAVR